MKAYRVITGSTYNSRRDCFEAVAFHMTFWVADKEVLPFLMIASGCPNGKVFPSEKVKGIKDSAPTLFGKPFFSAN